MLLAMLAIAETLRVQQYVRFNPSVDAPRSRRLAAALRPRRAPRSVVDVNDEVGGPLPPLGASRNASHRTPVAQMNARWDDPILDESIPDPVFDDKSPYLGRVPYGFSRNAEVVNGRTAMMGFTIAYLQELFAGRGVLQQYGLPYDVGAVVPRSDGFMLPWPVALVLAVAVTVAATYKGAEVGEKLFKDESFTDNYKLPDLPFLDKLPKLPVDLELPNLPVDIKLPFELPGQNSSSTFQNDDSLNLAREQVPTNEAELERQKDEVKGLDDELQPQSDPGSTVPADAPLSDIELVEQEAKLKALSEKWKKREDLQAYQESIRSGFGPDPETINGRTAMFFIIVGLITEYYTGQSMPAQVNTLLESLSIIG